MAPKPPQRAASGPKLIQKPELTACDLAALQEQREINLKNGKTNNQKATSKECTKGLGIALECPSQLVGFQSRSPCPSGGFHMGTPKVGFFLGSLVHLLHNGTGPVAQRITARADPYFHPKIQTS